MRTCTRCQREQVDGEFYRSGYGDRLKTICRTCALMSARERRAKGLTQGHDRARYQRSERYRGRQRRKAQAWRRRNREKLRAQWAVQRAIKKGEMTRQGCEVCGVAAHAHHEDYGKPLEVRWLCALHHVRHHAKATS